MKKFSKLFLAVASIASFGVSTDTYAHVNPATDSMVISSPALYNGFLIIPDGNPLSPS